MSKMRFSVSQVSGGPWIVVDRSRLEQLVASCPNMDAAQMVAAVMNGDMDGAIESRKAVLAALDMRQ
jgi:hypothetical protein